METKSNTNFLFADDSELALFSPRLLENNSNNKGSCIIINGQGQIRRIKEIF